LIEYLGLFAAALLSATLLPGFSEITFSALMAAGHDPMTLWLWAVSGNTLGGAVNWLLGRYLLRFRKRRWFPVSPRQLERAEAWYARYGIWSLLGAWLPVVGDPLTLIAGIMRIRFVPFLLLTAIGKGARYAALAGLVSYLNGLLPAIIGA
jgi:membrane protein YqaA with SNARE-associated domain